jgi:SAM-dependent methyltransferase
VTPCRQQRVDDVMRVRRIERPDHGTCRTVTVEDIVRLVEPLRGDSRTDVLLADKEIRRMALTASQVPVAGEPDECLLDIGGTVFWVPVYQKLLGYARVVILARSGETFAERFDDRRWTRGLDFEVREADAELDPYPVESDSVACVTCFELLEHCAGDPMHVMVESHRVLRPGGVLCLTTPNVLHRDNLLRFAFGGHPFGWAAFTHRYADRHNREYTPNEVLQLLRTGGFDVDLLSTFDYADEMARSRRLMAAALCLPAALAGRVDFDMRGQETLARGTKTGLVLERYPRFLYALYGAVEVSVPAGLARPGPREGADA